MAEVGKMAARGCKMTRRQSEIFEFIKEYIGQHRYSPTYQTIADEMGLSSLASVSKHLQNLKAQGRIDFMPNLAHSIKIVKQRVDNSRFELESPDRLWDKKLKCYWIKETK